MDPLSTLAENQSSSDELTPRADSLPYSPLMNGYLPMSYPMESGNRRGRGLSTPLLHKSSTLEGKSEMSRLHNQGIMKSLCCPQVLGVFSYLESVVLLFINISFLRPNSMEFSSYRETCLHVPTSTTSKIIRGGDSSPSRSAQQMQRMCEWKILH